MEHYISTPLTKDKVKQLKAGDSVYITGEIYTARDAAHKRLYELVERGEALPFDIKDTIVFYVGPTPPKPGQAMGSAGPTTSYRMDTYSPILIRLGQTGMIGKGLRSQEVVDAMIQHTAVYFAAIGGAGALLSKSITAAEPVAYEDLGAEAIVRLTVKDFPVVVAIDCEGRDLYDIGKHDYLASLALHK